MTRKIGLTVGLVLSLGALLGNISQADVVTDVSGNGNHATSVGGVGNIGDLTKALTFNGTDGLIDANGFFSSTMTTGTVTCWVKLNDDDDYVGFFGNPVWGVGSVRVQLDAATDGDFKLVANANQSSRHDVLSGFNPTTGTWYHVAMRLGIPAGTSLRTGISITDTNGNVAESVSGTYSALHNYDMSSFRFGHISGYLDGEMTDLRVYSEALSDADIALLADMDPNTTPSSTNLEAHYHNTLTPVIIPLPATIALLFLGGLGALLRRKK